MSRRQYQGPNVQSVLPRSVQFLSLDATCTVLVLSGLCDDDVILGQKERQEGYDVTQHFISTLLTLPAQHHHYAYTHKKALLWEQCVQNTEGMFWLVLTHIFFFYPSLRAPCPTLSFFSTPSLHPLSPPLFSLSLSATLSLPSSFPPLLTLLPSLSLYLRLLFFYSKLNLSLWKK